MTDAEVRAAQLERRVRALGIEVRAGALAPLKRVVDAPAAAKRSRGDREMAEFRRRVDAAGPDADIEVILEHMRVELGYETLGEKFARERGRSRRQALAA
jgi:hypothetical protein